MLKKLFIYEWKDSWKLMTLLNVLVFVMTIIGTIIFANDIWAAADDSLLYQASLMSYMIFYIFSIAALSMIPSLYFWMRFYRNLYTDQGYLMHTLPVTPAQLIWSKAFVAAIWSLISSAVSAFSIVTLVVGGTSQTSIFALIDEMDIRHAINVITEEIGGVFYAYVFGVIVLAFVSLFTSVFMGYAAVSLGQLFKKHRVGAAIGMYVLLYVVLQTVSSYAGIPLTSLMNYANDNSAPWMGFIFLLFVTLISAAMGAAFFFLTKYIMSNKLNLE